METGDQQQTKKGINALLTPEGFLMLSIALMLDIAGLLFFILSLLGVGIPGSWILDLAGLVLIGPWMFFRSGTVKATKKAQKIAQKALKKLGLGTLVEAIPFAGDIAFCWTWMVYSELTS